MHEGDVLGHEFVGFRVRLGGMEHVDEQACDGVRVEREAGEAVQEQDDVVRFLRAVRGVLGAPAGHELLAQGFDMRIRFVGAWEARGLLQQAHGARLDRGVRGHGGRERQGTARRGCRWRDGGGRARRLGCGGRLRGRGDRGCGRWGRGEARLNDAALGLPEGGGPARCVRFVALQGVLRLGRAGVQEEEGVAVERRFGPALHFVDEGRLVRGVSACALVQFVRALVRKEGVVGLAGAFVGHAVDGGAQDGYGDVVLVERRGAERIRVEELGALGELDDHAVVAEDKVAELAQSDAHGRVHGIGRGAGRQALEVMDDAPDALVVVHRGGEYGAPRRIVRV